MNKDLFIVENVRLRQTEGDTWFCLKDVLDGLGDKQTPHDKMVHIREWFGNNPIYTELGRHADCMATDRVNYESTAVYKSAQIETPDALDRMRSTTFINESLLYMVIMRSQSEKAMEFTAIVHGKILPQIRKTGSYTVDDGLTAEQKYRIECEANANANAKEKANAAYLALQMLYPDEIQRAVATGKYVKKVFGDQIEIPQIAAPEQVRTLNPTELGRLFEPAKNPRTINSILQELNFQYKDRNNNAWTLTETGKLYGVLTVVDKQYDSKTTGTPQQGTVYQIRWMPCTYDAIVKYLNANNEV